MSEEDAEHVKLKLYRDILNIPDAPHINMEIEENDLLRGNQIKFKFTSFKTPSNVNSIPKEMYFEFKLLDKKITTDHVTVYSKENRREPNNAYALVTNQTLEKIKKNQVNVKEDFIENALTIELQFGCGDKSKLLKYIAETVMDLKIWD